MSKLFKSFGTDKNLEQKGVWVTFDDTRFLISRSGGSNRRYRDVVVEKIKPIKHQVDKGTLSAEENQKLTAEIFAEGIVLAIEVKDEKGVWVSGVPTRSGVVPFSKDAVVALLLDLPDLFTELNKISSDTATFQLEQEEADLKNS